MKKKKVLIISGIGWHDSYQRHQKMALHFYDRNYEVDFMERVPSSVVTVNKIREKFFVGKQLKKTDKEVNTVLESVNIISLPLLPPNNLFFIWNRLVVEKFLKDKRKDEYDIIISYLPIPISIQILNYFNPCISIYDCVRDFINWGGYSSKTVEYEDELAEHCSIIICDSYFLNNKFVSKGLQYKTHQILPFVSEAQKEILVKAKVPKIINNIVYFGTVDHHIDYDLLNKLSLKGYKVHIIGKVNIPNLISSDIIMHGFKNNEVDLAEKIIEVADALIIPYKNQLDGVIPAKMMQCLATGLPIFIKEFYDAKVMSEFLYLYDTHEDLLRLISNYKENEHEIVRERMIKFINNRIEFDKVMLEVTQNI